jgi:hypothetical protein
MRAHVPSITYAEYARARIAGLATVLQQPERDFYLSLHCHRASALHTRPETPLHDSFNGFLIKP